MIDENDRSISLVREGYFFLRAIKKQHIMHEAQHESDFENIVYAQIKKGVAAAVNLKCETITTRGIMSHVVTI